MSNESICRHNSAKTFSCKCTNSVRESCDNVNSRHPLQLEPESVKLEIKQVTQDSLHGGINPLSPLKAMHHRLVAHVDQHLGLPETLQISHARLGQPRHEGKRSLDVDVPAQPIRRKRTTDLEFRYTSDDHRYRGNVTDRYRFPNRTSDMKCSVSTDSIALAKFLSGCRETVHIVL